jgi:hypothetical protein
MHYLNFEFAEVGDGVTALEAMASTQADRHAAVMAEVQQVMDWAWQTFGHAHGPVDEGHDWDHDLQVLVEDGCWHRVTLSLSASDRFVAAFVAVFGDPPT